MAGDWLLTCTSSVRYRPQGTKGEEECNFSPNRGNGKRSFFLREEGRVQPGGKTTVNGDWEVMGLSGQFARNQEAG